MTYLLARLAGFDQSEAEIVAYSSQYVDDSISDAVLNFSDGNQYRPVCSAHKCFDYQNFDDLSDKRVWVPFHFLPGNCSLPEGEGQDIDLPTRLICTHNSHLAQAMVDECILQRNQPNALHRLGITMHVFADTWAHRGFAGIMNDVNFVKYLEDDEEWMSGDLVNRVASYFKEKFDNAASRFIDGVLPLGHGAVLSYPDKPYLKWHYLDYKDMTCWRDNPAFFLDAAKNMFVAMKKFRNDDLNAEVLGLPEETAVLLAELIQKNNHEDGEERHKQWLQHIKRGIFSLELNCETVFIEDSVEYNEEGSNSWRYNFINSSGEPLDNYNEFLESNFKKFHDALKDHLDFVTTKLLPNFGIEV